MNQVKFYTFATYTLNFAISTAPSSVNVSGNSDSSLLVAFGLVPNSSSVTAYKTNTADSSCEVAADKLP